MRDARHSGRPGGLPWHDPVRWDGLRGGAGCALCAPLPPGEIACELATCKVRVPAVACVPGYACVIAARHVVELHDLPEMEAVGFAQELCRVGAAVQRLTDAVKLNLLSLGNMVPHLHIHICPRRIGDRFEGRAVDPGDVLGDVYAPGAHADYLTALRAALSG